MNRVPIFQGLSSDQIDLLKPLFNFLSIPSGTVIFQQGKPAEFLYLVIGGKVEMSFKPYDGVPLVVSQVGKGGLFGWSAVLGSDRYTSSAVATEEVEVYRVRGSELRRFCREHPEAGKDVLKRLADSVSSRWEDAHKQVQSILLQGMTEKTELA